MKVGILTFHHTPNFGAALQAVALATCLRELGHDVGLIDYRPWQVHIRHRGFAWAPGFWLRARARAGRIATMRLCLEEARSRSTKLRRVTRFVATSAPTVTTPFYFRRGLRKRQHAFDAIVAGSDEIWKLSRKGGFDPTYCLNYQAVDDTMSARAAASREWLSRALAGPPRV
jgi:hypothetical protein